MGSKHGKPVLRNQDVEDLMKSSGLSEQEVKEAYFLWQTGDLNLAMGSKPVLKDESFEEFTKSNGLSEQDVTKKYLACAGILSCHTLVSYLG
jgi:hypothetical protein